VACSCVISLLDTLLLNAVNFLLSNILYARASLLEETNTVQFRVEGVPIERVSQFKYLGRWLDDDDTDISLVFANIRNAERQWSMIRRLLCRRGASRKVMVRFYLAVVQSVLLYGSETWVLSHRLLRRLEAFHHKCARWLGNTLLRLKFWMFVAFRPCKHTLPNVAPPYFAMQPHQVCCIRPVCLYLPLQPSYARFGGHSNWVLLCHSLIPLTL